jgi:uncharacterized membrane protein
MEENQRHGPIISAGVLMGAGLGGFVDGIVFHQILQWHHMLSAFIPPYNLVNLKVNMFWDGVFHAGDWVLTVIGLGFLWRAGKRKDVPWSGRTFLGSLMAGWGLFNLVEGLIDHEWFGIHHVREYAENHMTWDMAFLAFGVVMLLGGLGLIREGRKDTLTRGESV